MVHTTNAIESVNYTIRKVTRNRQSFPMTDAALKLVFMAWQNISNKWTMPVRDWVPSSINSQSYKAQECRYEPGRLHKKFTGLD